VPGAADLLELLGFLRTGHAGVHEDPVSPVDGRVSGRLALHGQYALAALAGALGDELLHPHPERLERGLRQQSELVPPLAGHRAQHRAEPGARVLPGVFDGALPRHLRRSVEQAR
jgi:hypothetical protein